MIGFQCPPILFITYVMGQWSTDTFLLLFQVDVSFTFVMTLTLGLVLVTKLVVIHFCPNKKKQKIMKITITGALANIGKPLSEILIKNGHHLTIISNDSQKAKEIEALGAKAAIGSVADVAFLTKAFQNADAIYTMVPPNWGVTDYRQYIAQIGENYL